MIEPCRKQDSEGTVSAVDAEAVSESDSHSGSRLACQALSTAQQRVDESEMAKAEVELQAAGANVTASVYVCVCVDVGIIETVF